ncbi:hypothetical protein M3J09_007217 [Ascochyta lentis]
MVDQWLGACKREATNARLLPCAIWRNDSKDFALRQTSALSKEWTATTQSDYLILSQLKSPGYNTSRGSYRITGRQKWWI